jgi:hypothetical protein
VICRTDRAKKITTKGLKQSPGIIIQNRFPGRTIPARDTASADPRRIARSRRGTGSGGFLLQNKGK